MGEDILTADQEKVLDFLSRDPFFSRAFYFTGGTALANYYLHHRHSEDLDFFSEDEIDLLWLNTLRERLRSTIGAAEAEIRQTFNRNLLFFRFPKEILKTEFTYFPFKQIEPPKMIGGLRVDSLKDIAVNKFFTVYQKPSARHFIDLYLILKKGEFGWEELSRLVRIKFENPIDPVQLGAQLVVAESISDLPRLTQPLDEKEWRSFFLGKAGELKTSVS